MSKSFSFPNVGTCSKQTNIVLNDDHTIESVEVIGGCNGNLKGISRLLKGMKESVKLVGRGGKINAWIPSSAAYGTQGDKELGIQPNTTLYYEIELVDVDKYANWSRRSNLRR